MVQAQDYVLPAPGQMVALSPAYSPAVLKGIKLDPKNPFRFHFFVDRGDSKLSLAAFKSESSKLIKYFLASLTIPEKDLWVNLSPYEKDRIVPQEFGQTEMGRDLLAEDYLLKQITASLIYPESQLGKEFWHKVYAQAEAKYGTTNIPINTFNKVWIVPDKAVVYENGGVAFVLENHLKVMLEQDYLSIQKHTGIESENAQVKDTNQLGSQIVREIVIPALTKEVNEGKNFSQLRQVFYSLILATWYKKKIRGGILNKIYSDQNKIGGVNASAKDKDRIYQAYLKAFKMGVYSYIKEDSDPMNNELIPRKYFSGGVDAEQISDNMAMVGFNKSTLDYFKRPGHLFVIDGITSLDNRAMMANADNQLIKNYFSHRVLIGSVKFTKEDIAGYFKRFNQEKLQIGEDVHFVKSYEELKSMVEPLVKMTIRAIKDRFGPNSGSDFEFEMEEQFKIIYAMTLENAIDSYMQKKDMVEAEHKEFLDALEFSSYFYLDPLKNRQGENFELMIVNNGVPLKIAETTAQKHARRLERGIGNHDRSGGRGVGVKKNIGDALDVLAGKDMKAELKLFDRQEVFNDGQDGAVVDIQIPLGHISERMGIDQDRIPGEAIYKNVPEEREKIITYQGEKYFWYTKGREGSIFVNGRGTKAIKMLDQINDAVKWEHMQRILELDHMLTERLPGKVIGYDKIIHVSQENGKMFWGLSMTMQKGGSIHHFMQHEYRPKADRILRKIDLLTWFLADRHDNDSGPEDLSNFLVLEDGHLMNIDPISIKKVINAMEDEKISLGEVASRYTRHYHSYDRKSKEQKKVLTNYRHRLLQRLAFELKYRIIKLSQEEIKERLMHDFKEIIGPNVELYADNEEMAVVQHYINELTSYITEYQNEVSFSISFSFLEPQVEVDDVLNPGQEDLVIKQQTLQAAIAGFFYQHHQRNILKILESVFHSEHELSEIKNISLKEFQQGMYYRVFHGKVELEDGQVGSFVMMTPVYWKSADKMMKDDSANLEYYHQKHPAIFPKPIASEQILSVNLMAVEFLNDYIEMPERGVEFYINPVGRQGEPISAVRLIDNPKTAATLHKAVAERMVEAASFDLENRKVDFINRIILSAGDFMIKPIDSKNFQLKWITVRSVARGSSIDDFFDYLLRSTLFYTSKDQGLTKSIIKGIRKGFEEKFGKEDGQEYFVKHIMLYQQWLEEQSKDLDIFERIAQGTASSNELPERYREWLRNEWSVDAADNNKIIKWGHLNSIAAFLERNHIDDNLLYYIKDQKEQIQRILEAIKQSLQDADRSDLNQDDIFYWENIPKTDPAMIDYNSSSKGGIDLNPAQMSLQVKNGAQDFKFDFNGTQIDVAHVTGAIFTIRTMTPVSNLPLELGLNLEPANKRKQSA